MTMLDRMRRHSNWLKWSLALVCLSFVLFYIPDFLSGATGTGVATSTDTVAVVNGHEIRADEFLRTYQGMATSVPLNAVGIAVGFSAAVGIFFGFYPARKAAGLDPIEALRFE